jgi:hypothetical protein
MPERSTLIAAVPALLDRLFDDTALLPPAEAPMAAAVAAHAGHLRAWYAGLVGPLVCTEARLPELLAARAGGGPDGPLALRLVVSGGPGALETAMELAADLPGIDLAAVDVVLPPRRDPSADARRAAALLDALPDGTATHVELPAGPGGTAALAVLAGTGHGARLRTGGCTGPDFPSDAELAAFLLAAAAAGVGVSCTGGLRKAARNRSAVTGFEHHGFLNVLVGAGAAAAGAGLGDLLELLALRDEQRLAGMAGDLDDAAAAATRRALTSIGSGAVAEPVAELERLGLLDGLLGASWTGGGPRS